MGRRGEEGGEEGGEVVRSGGWRGRKRRWRVDGHRLWSVGRHRAQCAVVQSDCPEKNIEWLFKTAT